MSRSVFVVLLHSPVMNRKGEAVTTAVTNMDIHDISRSACTYGARGYYLVSPIVEQHELVGRILDHWKSEASRQYNPDRQKAVSLVRMVASFADVKQAIREECGCDDMEVVLTSAREFPNRVVAVGYNELRASIADPDDTRPVVLVFGTGGGVADVFLPEVDRILAPIHGPKDSEGRSYNHLSVRAAVGIILDRLLGQ